MYHKLRLLCFIIFLSSSNLCFAESYSLTVSNETNDLFKVQSTGSKNLPDLYPHESGKNYEAEWIQNAAGTWVITFRFMAIRGGGLEVYVIGTRSGDSQRVFCSSGSIDFSCKLDAVSSASGNLIIARRADSKELTSFTGLY